MIITGFDLATATGICDGPVAGSPRVFSWYLDDAGKERPPRLAALMEFLERYFKSQPCDAVVYEAPMPVGVFTVKPKDGRKGFQMSEANVSFARGAIGVLEAMCSKHGKPVKAVGVQDARESVLGWRTNRDKSIETKRRVVRDAKLLMSGVEADNENEVDAFVLWRYACNLQNPRLALAVTPLFGGLA